jgi:hypothetical protein
MVVELTPNSVSVIGKLSALGFSSDRIISKSAMAYRYGGRYSGVDTESFLSGMTHIQAINRGRNAMSSKVIVLLEDDLDGTKADETIEFGLDGVAYAIDLSDDNAKKLRGALDGYVRARHVR